MLSISAEDVLKDTINGCLCIASRGIPNGEDYTYFKDGISRIRNHIIGSRFGGDVAGAYAGQKIEIEKPKRFSYMRIVDPLSYGYLIEAAKLLQGTEFVS